MVQLGFSLVHRCLEESSLFVQPVPQSSPLSTQFLYLGGLLVEVAVEFVGRDRFLDRVVGDLV